MTSYDAKPSSSEVAQEAEDVRAGLAHTLDQLRENLRPENVVEEVVSNARIGANTVADSLYGLARDNPIPALLIGAGCALVMGFGTRKAMQSAPVLDHEPAGRPARRDAVSARVVREVLPPLGARDGDSDTRGRRQGSGASFFRSKPSAARDTMDTFGKSFPRSGQQAASRLSGLLHEQPLILAAIGVAVGAAIGAALPGTTTEDEWLGSASSSVRHAAEDAARSELDELRTVASRTMDSFKESASQHGFSSDNMRDLVQDAGERAKSAIRDVGAAAGHSDATG